MKQVVVVGGGLAGLSGAFHLREFEPRLFEREDTVGGVCRSFCQDGFTFDVTGHLLHLKNDYTQGLVDRLLPAVFQPYERRAAIYSKKKITPYPFQANTYGLPPEVVRECLIGFIESLDVDHGQPDNFQDWILHTFGSGIARHFMLPFNEKFWKVDLREITADWVSWSIPKPTLEEVVDGALGLENKGMGYNPRFYYPKSGGIDCLPHALARHLQHVYTGHDLEAIDGENRVVRFSNGRQETYECLLATIPLPIVFELLDDAPDRLREAARKLRAISVLDINVGVDRPSISDKHWIYFPEPEFVFSRVGFPTNFSKDAARRRHKLDVHRSHTSAPRQARRRGNLPACSVQSSDLRDIEGRRFDSDTQRHRRPLCIRDLRPASPETPARTHRVSGIPRHLHRRAIRRVGLLLDGGFHPEWQSGRRKNREADRRDTNAPTPIRLHPSRPLCPANQPIATTSHRRLGIVPDFEYIRSPSGGKT